MRSSSASNYAGRQYLLSPGTVASTGLASALPPTRQQQKQARSQHHSKSLVGALPMLPASTHGEAGGRIQQQIASAVVGATVASNYPPPHPQLPPPPPMASNKLDSGQPAPQLAPASAAKVHYHAGTGGINGFKAALRHPQKFIHNLYSGSNIAKSSQWAHGKQQLKASDQQQAFQQHQHQQLANQHRPQQVSRFPPEAPLNDAHHLEPRQEQYASQLRSSPLLQRFQQQQQQSQQQQQPFSASQQMQQRPGGGQQSPVAAPSPSSGGPTTSTRQVANKSTQSNQSSGAEHRSQQVNFNRSFEQADEAGESRKKKYLTAKYGQQQMSLIKKRLKIEMWLYEQLQELAKNTKSEAELEEIEIDLDQLLDMDDDETRRRWLKKTLEPFEELQPERIDKFINDVLDQSKLL